MPYDLVKQKFPGAPCALGVRVQHRVTGRTGNIVPQRAGDEGVRVKFDGEFVPKACHPREISYLDAPVVQLDQARR